MNVLLERQCGGSADLVSRLGISKSRAGPDGRPVIRYATLLNFLRRVAGTHNLQLTPLPSVGDSAHPRTSVWRLGSECFAVQICMTKSASADYDSATFVPGTNSPDEFVHVSAVCFEHSHEQSMSPELVADLNAGKFESLAQHVSSLMTIYSIPGTNLERVRAYLCLDVLEQDLSMLSQSLRPDLTDGERNAALALRSSPVHTMDAADRQRVVNSSIVGLFLNRSGGRLARLTYLITPAQAAIARATPQCLADGASSRLTNSANHVAPSGRIGYGRGTTHDTLSGPGFAARVGLRSRLPFDDFADTQPTVQHLPIIPLVTLRETNFGDSVPDFAEPDELKCVALEAELVLYLDPPIPLPTEAVRELELITGLKSAELLDKDEDELTRLILAQHNQEYLYGINPHIHLPNYTQHSYNIQSRVRGFLVHSVPFTCSSQLSSIIAVLRRHASIVAFYETFVLHPVKPSEKDELLTFHFDIEISSGAPLRVSFDHPCDPSRRVDLSLQIGPFGVTQASVNDTPLLCDSHSRGPVSLDPTDIFARSHSLPVGLVWLLLRLGCPIQRSLRAIGSSHSVSNANDVSGASHRTSTHLSGLTSSNRLEQLRSMLSRARSHVLIHGTTGTGGILSGADRFAAPELDTPLLLHPLPTLPPIGARASLKIPPLPPGVLVTPPPVLPHTAEHGVNLDLLPNTLSTVRSGEPIGKGISASGVLSPSVTTSSSRGLRLDDLLIGNVIQQCFANSTAPSSSVPSSAPNSAMAPMGSSSSVVQADHFGAHGVNPSPTGHPPQAPGVASQSKLIAAMRDYPMDSAAAALCGTVSPKQSAPMGGTQSASNYMNVAGGAYPSYGARVGGAVSVSTANISIPGTFTQSSPIINPLLGSKSGSTASQSSGKALNSGSMLVNLLNEDPLPPTTPSVASTAHCIPSARAGPSSAQPPPGLSSYPEVSKDPYALPGTTASSRFISSPPDKLGTAVTGKVPGTTAAGLPVGATHLPGVGQSLPKPSGLHSPRSGTTVMMVGSTAAAAQGSGGSGKSRSAMDAYSLDASDSGSTGPAVKKARKRRRAGADAASIAATAPTVTTPAPMATFKPSLNVNPVPGVSVLCAPSSTPGQSTSAKHSRGDPNSIPHGSLHRSTFSGGASASGPNSFAMTSASSTVSAIGASVTNTGKSVYDFDDNPNSSFDMPTLPVPSNPSVTGTGGTGSSTTYQTSSATAVNKLSVPGSTGPPSALPTTVSLHPSGPGGSASGAGGPPTVLSTGSVSQVAERTVERKSSLKMTIKALPPQPPSNAFSKGPPTVAEVVTSSKLTSPEAKSKHSLSGGSGVPGLTKKRKRRSIEGKPSSYMLQMLQPPVSSATSTPLSGGLKLAKPSTALSHANSIVKKERKRRMTHLMTEQRVPSSIVVGAPSTGGAANSVPLVGSETSKMTNKVNRSRESSADGVRTKPTHGPGLERTSSSGSLCSSTGPGGPGMGGRKKVNSSPMATAVTEEGNVIVKRQHTSASGSYGDSVEVKRRKHGEVGNKHISGSSLLNLSGSSSVSESDELQSTLSGAFDSVSSSALGPSTKHSSKSVNASNTFVRSGSTLGSNSTSKLPSSGHSSYSIGAPSSALSTPGSTLGTTGATGGASVGLIKGYKIPKKKSTNPTNPVSSSAPSSAKTDPSATSSSSSDVGSKSGSGKPPVIDLIKDGSEQAINIPGTLSSSVPTGYAGRSEPTPSASGSQTQQHQASANVASTTSTPTTTTPTATGASASSSLSAAPPRRRISDIVDKLRAKSSTSSSGAPGTSSSASGPDGCAATDTERPNLSGEVSETNAPDALGGQPDQRGDNIFEKFSSSAPTPTDSSKQPSQGDAPHRSPIFGAEDNPSQDSSSKHGSPHATPTDDTACEASGLNQTADERQMIKAQTDTPASPTEASTSVPTPPTDSASKIIPISPTSAKRMDAGPTPTGPSPATSTHPDRLSSSSQSRGAPLSRKNPCSVANSARFSRPAMSSHPHGVPDSYMRPVGGHPRGGRPPRVYSHGMHRPKAVAFKAHGSWPGGPVDFGAGAGAPGGPESAGGGGSMLAAPWRMPGAGSVPGTAGGGGGGGGPGGGVGVGPQQQAFNPSNPPPHGMPMHGFPPSGPRPMQHPPGAFGTGGNLYGGSM